MFQKHLKDLYLEKETVIFTEIKVCVNSMS